MKEEGLLTMSTEELERLSTIQRIIDKKITQTIAAAHLGLTVRPIKRLVKQFKQNRYNYSLFVLPLVRDDCNFLTLGKAINTDKIQQCARAVSSCYISECSRIC